MSKIILESSDGISFEVDEAVALKSQMIANMVEDDSIERTEVPLANVSGKILAKVTDYCNKHVVDGDDSLSDDKQKELQNFDAKFMNIDESMVFKIMLAANYLNIQDLLDLTLQTAADMIKDKTVEEVRAIFNIKTDFTIEEEAKFREENQWAFE